MGQGEKGINVNTVQFKCRKKKNFNMHENTKTTVTNPCRFLDQA